MKKRMKDILPDVKSSFFTFFAIPLLVCIGLYVVALIGHWPSEVQGWLGDICYIIGVLVLAVVAIRAYREAKKR